MKLTSSRGLITVDEKKYRYMVVYEAWHIYKKEWVLMVSKRTNDEKAARRELKRMTGLCNEYTRNPQIVDTQA